MAIPKTKEEWNIQWAQDDVRYYANRLKELQDDEWEIYMNTLDNKEQQTIKNYIRFCIQHNTRQYKKALNKVIDLMNNEEK